ncbi:hypothetical protein ACH5RR_006689 [Cinchona calisaya]|uniref:Transposase, Ptta/En/Spm, plant n=1 Tax=Cinchona calisaya TaxID=153742 RepID=A0ABD3APP6_9GENT
MVGLGGRRSMRLPTITTSSAPTIPLGTENNPNKGVSSTIIEAPENVPVVLESNVEKFEANTLALEDWKWLCDHFYSDAFQEKSIRNSKNRTSLTTLPRSGSVSLQAYQHEEGCGDIDLYKVEFTNKNGDCVDKKHEDKYKKMKFDFDQAIENGDPMNKAAICAKHLGTTLGYIRGTGRGPKPPKKVRSSSTTILPSIMDEQMQEELTKAKRELTQATKKLDETGEELAETKKKLNRQQNMIDWMKDIVIEKFGMTLPTLCSEDTSGDGLFGKKEMGIAWEENKMYFTANREQWDGLCQGKTIIGAFAQSSTTQVNQDSVAPPRNVGVGSSKNGGKKGPLAQLSTKLSTSLR